jgi:hypothetical protein
MIPGSSSIMPIAIMVAPVAAAAVSSTHAATTLNDVR